MGDRGKREKKQKRWHKTRRGTGGRLFSLSLLSPYSLSLTPGAPKDNAGEQEREKEREKEKYNLNPFSLWGFLWGVCWALFFSFIFGPNPP